MKWAGMTVVAALGMIQSSCGMINHYSKEELRSNYLIYRKNAMYSLSDAPSHTPDARSSITAKLDFAFEDPFDENQLAQVSVIPMEEYEHLGVEVELSDGTSERIYCCTNALAKHGNICERPNSLIINKRAQNIQIEDIFPGGKETVRFSKDFQVKESGFYFLVISYCHSGDSSVEISGTTYWINPFGYLPGEVYGFLPFYSQMSSAYLFCALVWAFLCSRQWRDLLMLQNWCTAVIGFGLLEMYLRYMDLYHFNSDGSRKRSIMVASIFFLSLKKAVSRILVLTVSLGWGVVRPSLGEAAFRIYILGFAYFGFSFIQLTVENLSRVHGLTLSGYLLVLPVIALDFVFFMWIYNSLSLVINSLTERKQEAKLQLYKSFRILLILVSLVTSMWTVLFAYCVSNKYDQTHWETFWQLEAFWDVLYFAVLVVILFLWRPNSNSLRYSYTRVDLHESYDDNLVDIVTEKIAATKI